ncbi:MAG: hypothetical protein H7125_14410, partial [Proteobacteria bacterium]|nr:hypothetical protein [Burkholderiales bacterium]
MDLIPEVTTVRPGEPFSAVLRMRLAPGWHTYWSNPGDSGLPTHLEWRLPQGVSADPPQWPVPKRLPVGPLMNYGYEQEVLLPVRINVPSGFAEPVLRVAAQAEWLVCREVCIPETAPVGFELPTAPQATSADPRWQAVFTAARNALPKALPGWTASANVADGQLRISLQAPAGASLPEGELYFYNGFEGQVVHAKPQIVTRFRDGVRIEVPLHGQPTTPVERMSGVLVSTGGFGPERIGAISIASLLAPELPGLGPRLDGALAADRSRGATNAIPGASALP